MAAVVGSGPGRPALSPGYGGRNQCRWSGRPAEIRGQTKRFFKEFDPPLGAPNICLRLLVGDHLEHHPASDDLHDHIADLLGTAAVEAAGEPQHTGESLNPPLVVGREPGKGFLLALGQRAAMVAGHVGDQLQVVGPQARQAAIADEMVAVLVVLVVVDDVANVLKPSRTLEQEPVTSRQFERIGQLLEDPTGQGGHLAAVLEFT